VAALPAQSTVHLALSVHVTEHEPSHFTVQVASSWQATVLAAPTSILQSASVLQSTLELPPALSSHLSEPVHAMLLPSPPVALHCEVASQVNATGPAETASHFAPEVQSTAHPSASHVVLQSAPATHEQALPTAHWQPPPEHVAVIVPVDPLPPHAAAASARSAADSTQPITPRLLDSRVVFMSPRLARSLVLSHPRSTNPRCTRE
jgi:hypothetical protein